MRMGGVWRGRQALVARHPSETLIACAMGPTRPQSAVRETGRVCRRALSPWSVPLLTS